MKLFSNTKITNWKNLISLVLGFCLGCVLYNVSYTLHWTIPGGGVKKPVSFTEDARTSDTGIPLIIHQTWTDLAIPLQFEHFMKSWRAVNREWQYWFWTETGTHVTLSSEYGQLLTLCHKLCRTEEQRTNVRKYLTLYHYGGIFADLDMESRRPLSSFVDKHHCFVTQEPLEHQVILNVRFRKASNALMGCTAKHPFFKMVLDTLPDFLRDSQHYDVEDALYSSRTTGNIFLNHVYDAYKEIYSEDTNLLLVEPNVFTPTFDNNLIVELQYHCSQPQSTDEKTLCGQLQERGYKSVVMDTHLTVNHYVNLNLQPILTKNLTEIFSETTGIKIMNSSSKKVLELFGDSRKNAMAAARRTTTFPAFAEKHMRKKSTTLPPGYLLQQQQINFNIV